MSSKNDFQPKHKLQKCEFLTQRLRERGNELYDQQDYFEALIYLNNSLCFAEPGGKDMALTYGDRSKVYLDLKLYNECLHNIELAMKIGLPSKKAKKLIEREKRCKEMMEKDTKPRPSVWDFFKLSYPAHPKVPFIANCLEIEKDAQLGQLFVTNRDLKAGDFVAIVEAVFKMIDPVARLHRCTFCLQDVLLDMIPCSGCPMAMFCSKACAIAGEKINHYDHCSKLQQTLPVHDYMQRACSRVNVMLGRGNYEPFMREVFGAQQGSLDDVNFFSFDWTKIKPTSQEKFLFAITTLKVKSQKTDVESLFYKAILFQSVDVLLSRLISVPGEKPVYDFNRVVNCSTSKTKVCSNANLIRS